MRKRITIQTCGLVLGLLVAGCGGSSAVEKPPSTPPQIGWVADLTTRQHGVTGRVTVMSATTFSVTNFSYDGGGLSDVRFYAGQQDRYAMGFGFGPQLAGVPAAGTTLTLQLPAGRTLADLDGVSVWCVQAAVSFADARFRAP